ncbi:hypothetical protein V8C43DRAFT_322299 [Trichoderma afarasin]
MCRSCNGIWPPQSFHAEAFAVRLSEREKEQGQESITKKKKSLYQQTGHKEQLANHNDELLVTIRRRTNPSNMSAYAYVGTCRCGRSRAVDSLHRQEREKTRTLTMSMLCASRIFQARAAVPLPHPSSDWAASITKMVSSGRSGFVIGAVWRKATPGTAPVRSNIVLSLRTSVRQA